jgi:Protein of unknown function (DUF4058)
MPLHDHFHKPLSIRHPWTSVHSAWANAIVQQLNQDLLPSRYYALPTTQIGGRFEIDVATLDDEAGFSPAPQGGTAIWAPSKPAVVFPVDFADLDVFEVQIMDEESGKIVAAIELVSPANKDRTTAREAFTYKCAGLLQQGVSVLIVDVVTERKANLAAELVRLMHGNLEAPFGRSDLYAVACRVSGASVRTQLELWPELLQVGHELPTLPLWIGPEFAIPLDLEQSYSAACGTLRLTG